MENKRAKTARPAFTLIELLVVIGIISLLIGIIAPGLKGFVRHAKGLKQKAILHSMETGLHMFESDFGDFPDSAMKRGNNGSPPFITGAQHLVEALVGRDGRGFEPKTKWYAPTQDPDLYLDDTSTPEGQKSLYRRKGPYAELKDTGAYLIQDSANPDQGLFDPSLSAIPANLYSNEGNGRAPVFADIFRHRTIRVGGTTTRVGNPIVYFKANQASRIFPKQNQRDDPQYRDTSKWIYDYEDNRLIFQLRPLNEPTQQHLYDPTYNDTAAPAYEQTGRDIFYNDITDPKVKTPTFDKPFNSKSFILMSAGYDGIFGTKDDITNINY